MWKRLLKWLGEVILQAAASKAAEKVAKKG